MKQMTILEAARNVDRSEKNSFNYIETDHFCDALGIDWTYGGIDWCTNMVGYHIAPWMCTDTWVGLSAYYLNNELVAVSWQPARKSDIEVQFVSIEAAEKVRNALIEEVEAEIPILNPEETFEFQMSYNCQLLDKEKNNCFYNNKKVTILNSDHSYKSDSQWGISSVIQIQLDSGEILDVELSEVRFGLRVEEK